MKEIYLDVETTGLSPKKHGIWQLAGMVVIDGKDKYNFNYHINPKGKEIDPKALAIGGITEPELSNFSDPDYVYNEFIGILKTYVKQYDKQDKFTFIAYNALFDMDFMRQLWYDNDDKYFGSFFFFPPCDVMILASRFLMHSRHTMKDMKLMTVAEKLGIEIDDTKAHDAMYDIQITREILKRIEQR